MIALIDYGAGNTASVANSLNDIGAEFLITKKETEILRADKVIFPGVGEASFAIKKLSMMNISNTLKIIKKPLLGICLGMQLLGSFSEEGDTRCLGIFDFDSQKFDSLKTKVPHMGWNQVDIKKESKLYSGIKDSEYFYFAHSFYVPVVNETTAQTSHGMIFSSSIEKNNFYGVQFHPEKSGEAGLQLLKNFIELC